MFIVCREKADGSFVMCRPGQPFATLAEAQAQATLLASKHPSVTFKAFKCVSLSRQQPVETVEVK